jgi:hypothetical protein
MGHISSGAAVLSWMSAKWYPPASVALAFLSTVTGVMSTGMQCQIAADDACAMSVAATLGSAGTWGVSRVLHSMANREYSQLGMLIWSGEGPAWLFGTVLNFGN